MGYDYYEVHENEYITDAERGGNEGRQAEGISKFQKLLVRFWLAARREKNSEGDIEDDGDLFRELCVMYRNKR